MAADSAARRALITRRPATDAGGRVLLILGYLALTLAIAHGSLYLQGLILIAAVLAVAALSLDLVLGVTGMFSLAHAGLLGLGAYLTTVIWTHLGINVFLLLPVAILGSSLFGLIIGAASLRVGGLQFAIVTFIFTLVFTTVVSNLTITGGADGLLGPTPPFFPASLSWLGSVTAWTTMGVLLIAIVVVWGIRRSPLYPVLLGIRDAERFAEASGARVSVIRIAVFSLSGAMVGMAGWAMSLLGSVSPDQFTWVQSVNVLIMVLLGGSNTALGPIVGAAIVSMIPTAIGLQSYVDEVIFGAVMLVVVIVFPKGFVGTIRPLLERLPLRPGRASGAAAPLAAAAAPGLGRIYGAGGQPPRPRAQPAPPARPARPAPGTIAVTVTGVAYRYPSSAVRALNGIDVSVRAGTIHGLIGPNGSGKSTLIDVISGRARPLAGSVQVNGELVDGRAYERASLGFMRTFQAATLVSEMSALSNVVMGGYSRLRRTAARAPLFAVLPGSWREYRWLRGEAMAALSAVGVSAEALQPVADASQSVRQLVQLAAVCIARPATLVLDEPLAGLSVGEVENVGRLLRELKELGMTVIIVEHQAQFVFNVCDEVTVLSSGKVVVSGEAAMVRRNERVREVYLGL